MGTFLLRQPGGGSYVRSGDYIRGPAAANAFTLDAFLARHFTLDAIARASQSGTLPLDAVLRAARSGSWPFDAHISKSGSGFANLDAIIRTSRTGGYPFDAVLLRTQTGSWPFDAEIRPFFDQGPFYAIVADNEMESTVGGNFFGADLTVAMMNSTIADGINATVGAVTITSSFSQHVSVRFTLDARIT
jgi:hypothetical protein